MFIASLILMIIAVLVSSQKETGRLSKRHCKGLRCSYVFDPVCGMYRTSDNTIWIEKFHNECIFKYSFCEMDIEYAKVIPKKICNIKPKRRLQSRRVFDFGIVGAHQACNHSCPTYCVDNYEPVCARIWRPGMKSSRMRPMVNHCHVDLFSCAMAVNVTIEPLGKCYSNPSGLMFMSHLASLKSLKLLD